VTSSLAVFEAVRRFC